MVYNIDGHNVPFLYQMTGWRFREFTIEVARGLNGELKAIPAEQAQEVLQGSEAADMALAPQSDKLKTLADLLGFQDYMGRFMLLDLNSHLVESVEAYTLEPQVWVKGELKG